MFGGARRPGCGDVDMSAKPCEKARTRRLDELLEIRLAEGPQYFERLAAPRFDLLFWKSRAANWIAAGYARISLIAAAGDRSAPVWPTSANRPISRRHDVQISSKVSVLYASTHGRSLAPTRVGPAEEPSRSESSGCQPRQVRAIPEAVHLSPPGRLPPRRSTFMQSGDSATSLFGHGGDRHGTSGSG